MNLYFLIFGFIIGFLSAYVIFGKNLKNQVLVNPFKFKLSKYKINLHHWLIAFILLLFLITIGFYNDLMYGLIIGIFLQGLTYRDFYKIISKR